MLGAGISKEQREVSGDAEKVSAAEVFDVLLTYLHPGSRNFLEQKMDLITRVNKRLTAEGIAEKKLDKLQVSGAQHEFLEVFGMINSVQDYEANIRVEQERGVGIVSRLVEYIKGCA